jgi:elongation factor P--beta-lysine ligase
MCQDDRHAVVRRLRSQYQEVKETLAALLASIVEITQSSSITIKEGFLMYSPTGPRLLDTNYVREQVAQYRAARERKEVLRKRLMELGDPDPE